MHRISWAVRIVLLVVLWLPQPLLFFTALIGGIRLPDWYGFLGGLGFVFAVGVLLVAVSLLIIVAGREKRATIVAGVVCVALAALLTANHMQAASQFFDSDDYDSQTANQIADAEGEQNLEYGYEAYRPFSSNLIARLTEPTELAFKPTDDLPRVDSATALLPLASSFVTATYPLDSVTVQWEQGDFDEGFFAGYNDGFWNGATDKKSEEPFNDSSNGRVIVDYQQPVYARGYDMAYPLGYAAGYEDSDGSEHITYEVVKGQAAVLLHDVPVPDDAVFQYNNSSEGFTRLADNRSDVFFGTKADADQAAYAADKGVEFEYTPIGREGFVFLVNAENPVDSLTVQQVRDIYAGRITNWKQVGGDDEPIVAYQRNENSGSQSMMRRFMQGDTLMPAPSLLTSGSMGGLISRIASYDNGRGAIGYSFRYYVTDLVGKYDVKLLAIEGVEPTLDSISDESYPITGEFYAVTRTGDDSANLARFIDWILGPQGQDLVERSGYARL